MLESPLKKLRIINYLLIGLIFFASLLFIRHIISSSFTKKSQTLMPQMNPPTTPTLVKRGMEGFAGTKIKDITSYAPILEQNPFGSPMKLTPIAIEHKAEKPISLTELILVGTAVGEKKLSYAIFQDKSNPEAPGQELFSLGENVYGHGILTRIEKGWIELTQGTNTYTIPIIEPVIKEIQAKNTESPRASFAKKVSEGQYLLDQRKVLQALNNPEQILTDARLLPNIQDGRQEGFRVSEVKRGGIYESLGLRNGDILLRVNNLEISGPEVAIQAMSALRGMDTVNLDIIRNGSRMTMSYQIR